MLCALCALQESIPPGSSSLVNNREAEVVLGVYRELVHRYPQLKGTPSIGVISPYKAQVGLPTEYFLFSMRDFQSKLNI